MDSFYQEPSSGEKFQWRRRHRRDGGGEFQWSDSHISIVRGYFLTFSSICHFPELPHATLLDHCFSWGEFFMVPRLKNFHESENHIKKYQLLEGFIRFLLRLLCHETDLNIVGPCKDGVDNLEKGLRFLLTIIGDASFLLSDDYENEQIQKIMAEFEEVANTAGRLVHSLFFSIDGASREIKARSLVHSLIFCIDGASREIKLGIKHQKLQRLLSSMSRSANRTPKISVVDSIIIVDSLTHYLEDLMNQKDNRLIADVKKKIKILHERLISVKSSIDDTGLRQSQQLSEAGELKETLMRIGGTAHEAEYLITSFLVGDVPSQYLNKRLTILTHNIKLIGTEIRKKYNSGELRIAKDFSAQLRLQSKRNTEIGDVTVGFEDKETDILGLLLQGTERQVISIFGMPGLGKTTLAKKLYNHRSVKDWFVARGWCVVSQTYQRKSILTNILIDIQSFLDKDDMLINMKTEPGMDRVKEMEEESLAVLIHKTLSKRRYLIVLDDIWDSNVWDNLLRCFPDDQNGSKILLTTRNRDVASVGSTIYAMPSLSNDQCWELLKKKVFDDEPCPPELLEIGKKIAANCSGLPLAVVVIAGILSTMDKGKSTWKEVERKSTTYIFDDQDNSVMQILKLSYKHLPQHLKPCFLLFGVFEEDEEICVGKLMRLWIAEGFVHKEKEKSVEDVAQEYLMELIDKSLIMVAKLRLDGGVKTCVIHDLLRDFCLTLCEEENFLKFRESDYYSIYDHMHREHMHKATSSYSQHVRFLHGRHLCSPLNLRDMKLLRVLHFDRICYQHLMFGIEFLVFLRYLVIDFLPPSISSFTNLEYLWVRTNEYERVNLPPAMLEMKKLRHLHMASARYDIDCDNSQTNNLEFLFGIVILDLNDEFMLKCSPHLRKLKCKLEASKLFDLHFLTQLESLQVAPTFDLHFLEEIRFPSNIKKLTLRRFGADSEKMSMIGRLKNLEVLKLEESSFFGKSWDTRDDEFKKLKFLKLYELFLKEWNVESSQHFPMLQRLILTDCYDLGEIPCEIGEIPTLQLIKVEWLCKESMAESAKRIQQEQREMGNEELEVITNICLSRK